MGISEPGVGRVDGEAKRGPRRTSEINTDLLTIILSYTNKYRLYHHAHIMPTILLYYYIDTYSTP